MAAGQSNEKDHQQYKDSIVDAVLKGKASNGYFPEFVDEERARAHSMLDTIIRDMSTQLQILQNSLEPLPDWYVLQANGEHATRVLDATYRSVEPVQPVAADNLSYSEARSTSTSRSGSRPNSCHGTDSAHSMAVELFRLYPEFDVETIEDTIVGMKIDDYDEAKSKVIKQLETFRKEQYSEVETTRYSQPIGFGQSSSAEYVPAFGSQSRPDWQQSSFEPTQSTSFFETPFAPPPGEKPKSVEDEKDFVLISREEERLEALEESTQRFYKDAKHLMEHVRQPDHGLDQGDNEPLLEEYLDCLNQEEELKDQIERLERLVLSTSNQGDEYCGFSP